MTFSPTAHSLLYILVRYLLSHIPPPVDKMFCTITRLGLALSAPSIILTQSITTYSFTADGTPTSLVFTLPTVRTVTVTYTQAAVTLMPPPAIETHTFTVTAPAAEISSIEGAISQSVQVAAPQGSVVPVVLDDYTASVQIPASASIPEGTYTPSPVRIIAATPSAASAAAADASQAAANSHATVSEEATADSNAAADVSTTMSGIPTHLPIPITPLVHASAAVQSSEAIASEAASHASISASSAANGAVSAVTEDFASTASVPQAIITDTMSLVRPTLITASVTSTSGGVVTSTTSTSSSAAGSSSSSTPASSSSSTTPALSTSSTAAPQSGAVGKEVAGHLLGAAAGFVGLLLFV